MNKIDDPTNYINDDKDMSPSSKIELKRVGLENKRMKKETRLKNKQIKKDRKIQKAMDRDDNIRETLNNLVEIKKIEPKALKKLLKLVILLFGILFIVEVFMQIPMISTLFEGWILGVDGDRVKVFVYLTVFMITFIQVLPLFNIPMVPVIVVLWNLNWLVPNDGTGPPMGMDNLRLILSLDGLILILVILAGFLLGVIFNYFLGYFLGEKAYKWMNDGSIEGFDKWTKKVNGKMGKSLYFFTILFPLFPDDLIAIIAGATRIRFKFVMIANTVGRFFGLLFMMMVIPYFSSTGSSFPYMLVIYGSVTGIAIIVNWRNNRWLNLHMTKLEKINSAFDEVVDRINRRTSVVEEVISDIAYKVDGKTKSKINTDVDLLVFAVIDYENYINRKIRILVRCKSANYFEVIFDKIYMMSEKIDTLISDIHTEQVEWAERII